MDKYRKVERTTDADDRSPPAKSQIRITQQANIRRMVGYASKLLNDEEAGRVELRGMGKMIGKAITVCELLRRRIPGLHQQTKLSTVTIRDEYEPLEEGLDPVVTTRTVSCISIFLSPHESKIDKGLGYNAPMDTVEFEAFQKRGPNGRSAESGPAAGDGGEAKTNGDIEGDKDGDEEQTGPKEGNKKERKGRYRGRGGRGRYRGGRGRGGKGRGGRAKNVKPSDEPNGTSDKPNIQAAAAVVNGE